MLAVGAGVGSYIILSPIIPLFFSHSLRDDSQVLRETLKPSAGPGKRLCMEKHVWCLYYMIVNLAFYMIP